LYRSATKIESHKLLFYNTFTILKFATSLVDARVTALKATIQFSDGIISKIASRQVRCVFVILRV